MWLQSPPASAARAKPALFLLLGPLAESRPRAGSGSTFFTPEGFDASRSLLAEKNPRSAARHLSALARSLLDVARGPASKTCYRPDCPRELGNRSRCRFPPRRSHQPTKSRWAFMRFAFAKSLRCGARTDSTPCPPRCCRRPTLVAWGLGESPARPREKVLVAGRSALPPAALAYPLQSFLRPIVDHTRRPVRGPHAPESEPTTSG